MKPPVQIGAIVNNKYRIDAFLGSGGMSIVALAFHLELEQQVAIKFLHAPGLDQEQTVQRFKREARAGARIRSEHVVRVLDVGALPDGCPYIVMEHMKGHDLAEELAQRPQLPAAEVAGYLLDACEALAEAHGAGIVHRDLKPENLYLAERSDGTRVVKLLDFGISKSSMDNSLSDLALTRTASFMGSPLYMSPEQMRSSRNVDARSDIWSVGAILYEMLSGQLPFVAESIPELCLLVIGKDPKPLRELVPDLPAGLEAVVERCLEKDRERRYATVAELALALAPFAPSEGSSAARTGRILRLSSNAKAAQAFEATPEARPNNLKPLGSSLVTDSFAPSTGNSGYSVAAGKRLAKWHAPAVLSAAAALCLVGWWLSREAPMNQQQLAVAVSPQPVTPVPSATVGGGVEVLPKERDSTSRVADAERAENTPHDAKHSHGNGARQSRVGRAPQFAGPAAANSAVARTAPLPSAKPINAWDTTTFGGRH